MHAPRFKWLRPALVTLAGCALAVPLLGVVTQNAAEAPAAFDGQPIDAAMVSAADHASDQEQFDQVEGLSDGLGPIYNAQSCRECHQTPVSGAGSQITELRVGHMGANRVFETPEIPINNGREMITGRSLINDRAICAQIQQRVPDSENIRTKRLALSILGDGLIESISDQALLEQRDRQCQSNRRMCGQAVMVPVLEAAGQTAVGRFGWKGQHASLLSFAADAYLNEMGVTNRLLPDEVTKVCNPSVAKQPNNQPEAGETMEDVDQFARFMRATKPAPRDAVLAATDAAKRGAAVFDQIGCATCHIATWQTAAPGTKVNGGAYTVPAALGNKIFHPYSDFLLHDVGTGDGIPIAVTEHYGAHRAAVSQALRGASTPEAAFAGVDRVMSRRGGFSYRDLHDARNKLRTPPLWGLRVRSRLMHDGDSVQLQDAITRHRGEATEVTQRYMQLGPAAQADLASFLNSL